MGKITKIDGTFLGNSLDTTLWRGGAYWLIIRKIRKGKIILATTPAAVRSTPRVRQTSYPVGTRQFDLIAALLGFFFIAGLFVDGFAHNHGAVDESFFTPYHAVLYGSIACSGLFFAYHQFRNTGNGYAFMRALPRGYLLSFVGVIIFFIGGGLDLVWHTVFGFEAGIEALVSPSHLLLASSGFLIITGVLRASFARHKAGATLTLPDALPIIVAMLALLSLLTFFVQYADLFTQILSLMPTYRINDTLVSAILFALFLGSLFRVAVVLFIGRRWRLPLGAYTAIFTINALLMLVLQWSDNRPYVGIVLAAVVGGVAADVLLTRYQPKGDPMGFRLTAFFVPALTIGALFAILLSTRGTWLTIPLWSGSIFTCGILGLFLSYLMVPPIETVE